MTVSIQTILALYLLTASTLLTAASGDKIISPEQIDGVTIVNAEGLIEQVTGTTGLVLIDSRISADRKDGYIEGSISLTDTDTNCATLARHIPTLDSPVLFYCNGIRCGRSGHAAQIAHDCGYSRIYWFRAGMVEWREKQYPLIK